MKTTSSSLPFAIASLLLFMACLNVQAQIFLNPPNVDVVIPGTEHITPEPGIDLSGWSTDSRNLRRANFQDVNLSNANFHDSNLNGASFYRSDLTDANLIQTNLTDAIFGFIGSKRVDGANLTRANLTGAVITGARFDRTTGLTSAQLYSTDSYQRKNLTGTTFSGIDISEWDFGEQNLTNSHFRSTNLTEADLSDANLAGALFWGADLTNANLENANLSGASFGSTLTGANLSGAIINETRFGRIGVRPRCCHYFADTGFTSEQLYSTKSYQIRDLRGVEFIGELIGIDYQGWNFDQQNLSSAIFYDANLSDAEFSGALLVNSNFRRSILANVDFSGANLKNAILSGVDEINTARFTSATVYNQWTAFPSGFDPITAGLTFAVSPRGDFDGNDVVDRADLTILERRVRKGGESQPVFDFNQDSVADVEDIHYWVTNVMNTWIGDSNLDGEFNSGDFVDVFKAGKYETDELAMWSEGDWNADGRFDSGDFVAAFQGGGYERGPRTEVALVPEPDGAATVLCGVLELAWLRRKRKSPNREFTCLGTRGKNRPSRPATVEPLEAKRMLTSVGFAQHEIISSDHVSPFAVIGNDLDGDGDLDLVAASRHKVSWYENVDGKGTFGQQQLIDSGDFEVVSIDIGDPNSDGDPDVVVAVREEGLPNGAGAQTVWYENRGGQFDPGEPTFLKLGNNWTSTAKPDTRDDYEDAVLEVDVDGDGDQDRLLLWTDQWVGWQENLDGLGAFGDLRSITSNVTSPRSAFVGDFNGDGRPDVASASSGDDRIAWYPNEGTHFGYQVQVSPTASGATAVVAADLDGDGDTDALSASLNDGKIAWYENTDGLGAFGRQRIIDIKLDGAIDVSAGDIDGDGDVDVIASFYTVRERYDVNGNEVPFEGFLSWYENTDGNGAFGDRQIITQLDYWEPHALSVVDVDGDFDLDLITRPPRKVDINGRTSAVMWYENTDGNGAFSAARNIADDVRDALATDMDGDGDVDFLTKVHARGGYATQWHENIDGITFIAHHIDIEPENAVDFVELGDIDGDGDLDVMTATQSAFHCLLTGDCSFDEIVFAWYENKQGFSNLGEKQVLARIPAAHGTASFFRMSSEDIDGDGDLDLLAYSSRSDYPAAVDQLAWYENTDGLGSFGDEQIITTATNGLRSVVAADIDNDGRLDLLTASFFDGNISWFENRQIGDSNDDGVFDSADLVAVFAAGEYEDGITNNSTFGDGDWNGDGEFDSSDLVAAFKAGTYVNQAKSFDFASAVDTLFDDNSRKPRYPFVAPYQARANRARRLD